MATRMQECYREREQAIDADGDLKEVEIPYFVFEASDESAALSFARLNAPSVSGMELDSVEIDERIAKDIWKVRIVYAVSEGTTTTDPTEPTEEVTSSFAFDTGGGTMHLNQSLSTVGKFPEDAPDFKGAIAVDNDGNVNGVDVTMPVLNFTETHTFESSKVTNAYKKTVASLTGSVNNAEFRGFEAGEVLFLGASGTKQSKSSKAKWEITFRFAVSPNKTNLDVGGIKVTSKKGWDYLWARYGSEESEDKRSIIKKPTSVYVEQVYPSGNFSSLGLG